MARNTSVMGIYTDRATVSDAINVLQKNGYRATDISVLASDNAGSKDFAHEKRTKALEGAATGALAGAAVGAALAWLVSMQIVTLTVLAPVVAAGPVLAIMAGAGAGGAIGWIVGLVAGGACPSTSPSGTRAESGMAAFSYPYTAIVSSGVTAPRKP